MGFLDDIKLSDVYKSENLRFKVKGKKNKTYTVEKQENDQHRGPEYLVYDIFGKGKKEPIATYELWFPTTPPQQWIRGSKFINWTSEEPGAKPDIEEEEAEIIIRRILSRIGFKFSIETDSGDIIKKRIPVSFCKYPQQVYGGSKLLRLTEKNSQNVDMEGGR